ncbi:hypothetical protein GMOD_00002634 [Pyrenophora seminiperda CCB06]|uniref:Uncharacterized protein n=1 Tax=Pyrenophora seminiperda CCB06 TaxID=1302712 RepID=A0A3M7M2U2_9PLEO|nr:hypothetical protein GMOD_00002634 [Pyrenophora seminiperda CCB06]
MQSMVWYTQTFTSHIGMTLLELRGLYRVDRLQSGLEIAVEFCLHTVDAYWVNVPSASMKLLTCFFALAGLATVTHAAVALPPSTMEQGVEPSGCREGDQICTILPLILNKHHAVKTCNKKHQWIVTQTCVDGEVCDSNPSPHCVRQAVKVPEAVKARHDGCRKGDQVCDFDTIWLNDIVKTCNKEHWWVVTDTCLDGKVCTHKPSPHCVQPKDVKPEVVKPEVVKTRRDDGCTNGLQICAILPLIVNNRHAVKTCINHNWVVTTMCNIGEVCDSNPSPRCVRQAVKARRDDGCTNGDQKCAILPLIVNNRHAVKTCMKHNWVVTTMCDVGEVCASNPFRCVRQ